MRGRCTAAQRRIQKKTFPRHFSKKCYQLTEKEILFCKPISSTGSQQDESVQGIFYLLWCNIVQTYLCRSHQKLLIFDIYNVAEKVESVSLRLSARPQVTHYSPLPGVCVCVCVVCLALLSALLSSSPFVSSFVSVISVYLHESYSTCIQRGCLHLMCLRLVIALAAPRRQQLCNGIDVSPRDAQNDRWHRWLLSLAADFRSLPSWRLDAPATAWWWWSTETNRRVKLSLTINPLKTPMPKRCLGFEWEPKEAGAEPTRLPITKEWHEKAESKVMETVTLLREAPCQHWSQVQL